MKIAYNTTDPVNASTVLELAESLELLVCLTDPRCEDPGRDCQAVVHDLAFLPRQTLDRLLAAARDGQSPRGVAVHSWSLPRATVLALRGAGALVETRLSRGLLRRAVSAARGEAVTATPGTKT